MGDFQVMNLLLTPPRKMRMFQRCRRLGSRPDRWFDASVASGKWLLARCSLKAKIWRWYFVEPGGVGGGEQKYALCNFSDISRSVKGVNMWQFWLSGPGRDRWEEWRRRWRRLRGATSAWFFIEGAVGICWLRVKVFHVQKTGSHLFLPTMSPLWCQLNEPTAAVSAKPRSFSFATQLHTTSPPLQVSPCLCFSCFVWPLW